MFDWFGPAPPNFPLRDPKYHLIETIRPLIEVHWGVLGMVLVPVLLLELANHLPVSTGEATKASKPEKKDEAGHPSQVTATI